MKLDTFTRAYLEAALWSSDPNPRSGEWSERDEWSIDKISAESIAAAVSECEAFQTANADDLSEAGDDSQNGHDFWLTRNHHGAGFWDRGYGDVGQRLTDAAQKCGERCLIGPETNDQGTATPKMLKKWDGIIHIERA